MRPGPTNARPLDASYQAVARACGLTAVHLIERADHTGPADRPGEPSRTALHEAIDHQATLLEGRYGAAARRPVAALWALHRHLLVTGLLLTGPYLLHRRVPRIHANGITLDPAAASATVTLAGAPGGVETAAHTGELRSILARHYAPILAAYGPQVRAGERSLWGAATDQIAGGLWHLGRTLNREREATTVATALLPGDTPPFVGGAAFRQLASLSNAPDDRAAVTRTRVRCCLLYTLSPEDTCATCPRRRAAG
ncbi:MAG: (2Fe-2S)-binding protein [Frankia sp.]